jgi:hypothetical protein
VAVRTPAGETLTVPPDVVAKKAPKRNPKDGFHDTDIGRGGSCCAFVRTDNSKANIPETVSNIFLPDKYRAFIKDQSLPINTFLDRFPDFE